MFNLKYQKDNSKTYMIAPLVQSFYLNRNISEALPKLKKMCQSVIDDNNKIDNSKKLLGEIKLGSQLSINHLNNDVFNLLKKDIIDLATTYINLYPYKYCDCVINLDSIWIVNQKATDYNPIHIHENSASDYGLSGFIHINLPSTINKEKNLENLCNSNSRGAKGCHDGITSLIWKNQGNNCSKKSFIYPGIIKCPLETGILYIFPSWLDHCVYPFYDTSESRITIAYNVSVSWKDNK